MILLGYKGNETEGAALMRAAILPSIDLRDRIGYVLGISIGLGAVFGESELAELTWLRAARREIGGVSALDYMLEGRMANLITVVELVSRERGL
jgi:hypothetical protein